MIRFCDKEVICIEVDKIKRQELLSFFLNGHISEYVCVVDSVGGYLGMITYYSLLRSVSINNAILRTYAVLDENIWNNLRRLFNETEKNEYELIPVVDAEGQLVSFAYEDAEANREIRMLRELMEKPEALGFCDIYSEYQCVRIYEFNELAVRFAEYLKLQGVSVQVQGALWKYINTKFDNEEFLEYHYMNIYAEGINPKPKNWMENLLRTVSVEFECIDKIYEANIKKGIIRNTNGSMETLCKKLQETHAVAILGTGVESQDAYDYFVQRGINVCCFVIDGKGLCNDRLFGKPILNLRDVIRSFGSEIVFIECLLKGNSAWGSGGSEVDYFDYMGFERNKRFFCLREYTQLQWNGLKNVLKNRKIVLAGDYYLCESLANYLRNNGERYKKICYLWLDDDGGLIKNERLQWIKVGDMTGDELCLIVLPEYHIHPVYTKVRKKCKNLENQIKEILKQGNIDEYSTYFSHMISFINIEKQTVNKYPHEGLGVKKIVLGSINSRNGNSFFRGLLDGHPSIMLWDEYSYFNNNLFWFCIRLANRDAEDITMLLKQMYRLEAVDEQFENEKFEQFLMRIDALLIKGEKYTSQELFVAFHMARSYVQYKDKVVVAEEDKIIYWEPHFLPRKNVENFAWWLNADRVPCEIVNVVRNTCSVRGSLIKDSIKSGGGISAYGAVRIDGMFEPSEDRDIKRQVMRFEDLKCNPKEELQNLCSEWGIAWSESLMSVTHLGGYISYYNSEKNITGFDLTPVYNKYEEYLSEFDRFRLILLGFSWQKTYGYPYVDPLQFSRRDLQEMYLADFRFSGMIEFKSEESKLLYHIGLQNYIRQSLWNLRVISWMDQFGTAK